MSRSGSSTGDCRRNGGVLPTVRFLYAGHFSPTGDHLSFQQFLGRFPRLSIRSATRWLAYALTKVEKGYRRTIGHRDLPKLTAAFECEPEQEDPAMRGIEKKAVTE